MLSETLNALIKESGKSQRQVATDLKLGIQRFNYYVTGKREPDTNTLQSIAEYFSVSVDYLLGREAQQKKPTVEDDGLSDRQRAFMESVRSMSTEDLDLLESLIAVMKKQKE